jgi:CheY-like chemotaxis protein
MRQMTVLLVEDNPHDVRLIQRAFNKADVPHHLYIVHDGDDALTYLAETSVHTASSTAHRPDLILLDLNLPRMNGHDVIRECKQDVRFKQIPIVVLTTSDYDEDIRRAYAAGANAYLLKPVEFARFIEIMHQLNIFWLKSVKLPPEIRCEEENCCNH